MSRIRARRYKLTRKVVAEHGGPVLCLDDSAIGRVFRLYDSYPGPELNETISADVVQPDGTVEFGVDPPELPPQVVRVDIRGPLEQRASEWECGFSDGHDAIAERMIAALEEADVVMVIDSPGGAHAGLQESVRRVQEAKEKFGRRVYAYADEMIGSAAYWWAACVADEIYGPESMLVGSIGARAGHQSIAGMLEREGVDTTYFAWPGAGKVAFAPELPLSELGEQRGNRDVTLAGEAFARAVSSRRPLTRDNIIELDADVLSDWAAVDAGLVDGIASLEDVLEYALRAAAGDGEATMTIKNRTEDPKDPESPDKAKARKNEEPDPEKKDPEKEDEEEDPDEEPDEDEDKKARKSRKTRAEDEDEDEDDDEDEKSDRKNQPPPPEKARKNTLASILGLRENASIPAVKSATMAYVSLGQVVMNATDTKTPDAARGALQAILDDAAEVVKLRAEMKDIRRKQNRAERMSLLSTLAKANLAGYTRGELFVDEEVDGKLESKPSPMYREMKLATLRGLVTAKTKGIKDSVVSPFEPDRERAKSASIESRAEGLLEDPSTNRTAQWSNASKEQLAQSAAALEAAGVL